MIWEGWDALIGDGIRCERLALIEGGIMSLPNQSFLRSLVAEFSSARLYNLLNALSDEELV